MFIGTYVAAFALVWRLTLVVVPFALLLLVPGFVYGRVLTGLARRVREQYTRPAAIAEQAVSSVRTVYSSVAERSVTARFSAALEESARLGIRGGLVKGVALGSNAINLATSAFILWYGSRLVMYHGYQAGIIYAISATAAMGGRGMVAALSNVRYLTEAAAAAERIAEVMRRVPKIDSESEAGEELANVAGEVEFKNVEFCYPSRPESPVLVNFSLRVPAGSTMALVGGSGSGKSTVIALLERFYDPSAGVVALDGVDIRRLRLKWLRTQMGLVSQEPALFAMSVRENILFGKEDATEEEIIAAAKAANAHSFISQLPQGYHTQVGERGIQMSGGQKQRIAIARAILRSPKILLLDEATRALDTKSERAVQKALVSVGRTTIVIAHNLSTVRNADTIAVMQSGQVKELGCHDELIANENGFYSTLIRLGRSSGDLGEADEVAGPGATHNLSRTFSWSAPSVVGDEAGKDSSTKKKLKPPVASFRRLLMLNASEWKHALMGSLSAFC